VCPQARLSDPSLNTLLELRERLDTVSEASCDLLLDRGARDAAIIKSRINLASVRGQ
jgi:hypothetical protein